MTEHIRNGDGTVTVRMSEQLFDWLEQQQEDDDARIVTIAAANLLHHAGYSLRDIAGALGVSHEWVRQHLLSTVDDSEPTL